MGSCRYPGQDSSSKIKRRRFGQSCVLPTHVHNLGPGLLGIQVGAEKDIFLPGPRFTQCNHLFSSFPIRRQQYKIICIYLGVYQMYSLYLFFMLFFFLLNHQMKICYKTFAFSTIYIIGKYNKNKDSFKSSATHWGNIKRIIVSSSVY